MDSIYYYGIIVLASVDVIIGISNYGFRIKKKNKLFSDKQIMILLLIAANAGFNSSQLLLQNYGVLRYWIWISIYVLYLFNLFICFQNYKSKNIIFDLGAKWKDKTKTLFNLYDIIHNMCYFIQHFY
ncbi:hypothetical protein pb186bvf_011741 [Paramecium bursaria]